MDGDLALTPEMTGFYRDVDRQSLQPLWIETARYVPRQPAPKIVPALWRHEDVLPLLHRAGDLIREGEADRRVLVLKNPGLPPFSGTTNTLYGCLQLLQPGETAPPHRHAINAFRFILSGEGACTTVDGTELAMQPGDFILTPGWSRHSHRHDGTGPMIWLDGLDNGIVNLFDASFFEPGGVPDAPQTPAARLIHPFATVRAELLAMRQAEPLDPAHGFLRRYTDPRTGDHALPTIAAAMQLLPAGFVSAPYRATDSTVFVVVEGSGTSVIGDREFSWQPQDIFVVPSWLPRRHAAHGDAILFSFSDRAAQEKLSLWREQRDPPENGTPVRRNEGAEVREP